MAYQTVALSPEPMVASQTAVSVGTLTNLLLDSAAESAAFLFVCPDGGGVCDKIIFGVNTIAGSCIVDIRIETVDMTTGFPTGTLVAAGATGQQASLVTNTQYEVTITTPPTLVEGVTYAVVIAYNAGTTINIANLQFAPTYRPPSGGHFTGSWAQLGPPSVAVKIGGTYRQFYGMIPARYAGAAVLSSSTPDELGNAFTSPAVKRRATGIWIYHQTNSALADFDLVLYEGTTVIETISVDASAIPITTGFLRYHAFATPRDIEASTLYRVTYKPTTTTANSGFFATYSALNADHMLAFPGGGTWYSTTRTDGGAFTDVTTSFHMIGLVFDAIDIPAGAGIARLIGDGLLT